ncbi:DUF3253 domain-containing protein [Marmoricola sp. URHB0036]|uniref:DUF3253 domain-containing protein n=1 Tax=Marmoricola sp. URHB0036 TaxID=1298863 RepID=UPI0004098E67|nr:DUF3253 domain-containing protein [Marmoricola sp. URHB0036]
MSGDRLEDAILQMLEERGAGKSICPSDVAREVGTPDGWRELMEPVRAAARRLVGTGAVEITQHGEAVDPDKVRGPIRIRRRQDA